MHSTAMWKFESVHFQQGTEQDRMNSALGVVSQNSTYMSEENLGNPKSCRHMGMAPGTMTGSISVTCPVMQLGLTRPWPTAQGKHVL